MSKERQKVSEHGTAPDAGTQAQRFIEAARELVPLRTKPRSKAKLAVIGRQKPKGEVPEPPEDGQGSPAT